MRRMAIVVAALLIAVLPYGRPTAASDPPDAAPYAVNPPANAVSPLIGWGPTATIQGRSLDVQRQGSRWFDDPEAPRGDTVGFGWRSQGSMLVLGYRRPHTDSARWSFGPKGVDSGPRSRDSGVVGFSVTLR
jgi:hypothetical protein